jgi:outer membrane protein assembly factor BamB
MMVTRKRWLLGGVLIATSLLASIAAAADSATRKFVAADSSKRRVAIVDETGATIWEHRIGPLHDLQVLPNGNLLFQLSWTRIVEMNLDTKKIIWEYDSAKQNGNAGKRIEVHAFQRLANGDTMIAESGVTRIIEVDQKGAIKHEVKLRVKSPHPHRDTRLVRKLDNGNYLVCHEGEGLVREYDPAGEIVWEFKVPMFGKPAKPGHGVEAFGNKCFSAIRLASGNTLIGTGNGHSVIEVTPKKKVVWELHQNDLPGIQLAWVTSLQVLSSGNILINNCHAGPENPQLVEVSRDKKVVWQFRDFERFGNSLTNSQILAVDGKPVK